MAKAKQAKLRELLRVYVQPDGALHIDVLGTWPNDPENHIPALLSGEVAKAVIRALAGAEGVTEFLRLNQPTRPQ